MYFFLLSFSDFLLRHFKHCTFQAFFGCVFNFLLSWTLFFCGIHIPSQMSHPMHIFRTSNPAYFYCSLALIYNWLPILGLLIAWFENNLYADMFNYFILSLLCYCLSNILTLSHKNWWFLFSLYTWSAVPDFKAST